MECIFCIWQIFQIEGYENSYLLNVSKLNLFSSYIIYSFNFATFSYIDFVLFLFLFLLPQKPLKTRHVQQIQSLAVVY